MSLPSWFKQVPSIFVGAPLSTCRVFSEPIIILWYPTQAQPNLSFRFACPYRFPTGKMSTSVCSSETPVEVLSHFHGHEQMLQAFIPSLNSFRKLHKCAASTKKVHFFKATANEKIQRFMAWLLRWMPGLCLASWLASTASFAEVHLQTFPAQSPIKVLGLTVLVFMARAGSSDGIVHSTAPHCNGSAKL